MKRRTRLLKMITLGIKKIRDPYYHGFAAQLAFYYILSIVPIVMLLSQLLLNIFQTSIMDALGWVLGGSNGNLSKEIESLVTFKSAGAVNIVYVFIALWAASRAQFSLTRITNFTFTDGRTTGRGYWVERIRAVGTMFVMIIAMFVAVVILIYGGVVLKAIFHGVNLWYYLRWPVAGALYFFVIAFIFYIMPMEKVTFRSLMPGTIFSSIGLLIVSFFYSLYVDAVVDYDIIYGALANIVALMFWFYFLAWVICLGVLFNKVWSDTKDLEAVEDFDYAEYIRKEEGDDL